MDRSAKPAWATPLLLALLLMTAVVSFDRAWRYKFDFHHFYADAAYTWQHGALNPDLDNEDLLQRRQLPFYLPIVPLTLSPLGALGQQGAAIAWTLMQVGCLVLCWRLLAAWSPQTGWLAWLLAMPVLFESARFNQLGLPVLALTLLTLEALQKRSAVRAGISSCTAVLLKLLPGVLLPWLLLKRQAVAFGTALIAGVLLTLIPCLLVFGSDATFGYLHEWWQHNVSGAPARGMTDADLKEHFIDHRNQSLPALLSRVTVADHPHAAPWQPLTLHPQTARRAGLLLLAGLAAAGLWVLRRPWIELSEAAKRQEISLLLLGMLVLGPLLRTYYLVWAIPGLLLLSDRAQRGNRVAQAGLAIWTLGLLAWTSEWARSYGAHWFVLVAVGICLLGSAEAAEDHGGVVATETE